jgi:hypothetical protein
VVENAVVGARLRYQAGFGHLSLLLLMLVSYLKLGGFVSLSKIYDFFVMYLYVFMLSFSG